MEDELLHKLLLALAAGTLGAVGLVSTGVAAPTNAPNAESFELVCDNGETYAIVVNGNGEWTPGHAADGVVLIPTGFPSFVGIFTDADGNEFPFEEPPSFKANGNAGKNKALVTCTFEVSFSDPETGESFEGVGEVEGFIVGKPAS